MLTKTVIWTVEADVKQQLEQLSVEIWHTVVESFVWLSIKMWKIVCFLLSLLHYIKNVPKIPILRMFQIPKDKKKTFNFLLMTHYHQLPKFQTKNLNLQHPLQTSCAYHHEFNDDNDLCNITHRILNLNRKKIPSFALISSISVHLVKYHKPQSWWPVVW